MPRIQVLDLTLPSMAGNLALDEALLLGAESGNGAEVLRFWEWTAPSVVLGSGGRLAEDVHEAACQADGVGIWRRSSGGGTVLLGSGCLCYSLVLATERSPELGTIRTSYHYILSRVRKSLAGLGQEIELTGTSDLAVNGRKFSGNSQQRKQQYLLHHGTLLYSFDISRVGRYLREPSRQPDYRVKREHQAFLVNLSTTVDEIKRRLRLTWKADLVLRDWPRDRVNDLKAKYESPEWIRRR
jgi:lipoate---protein ligase